MLESEQQIYLWQTRNQIKVEQIMKDQVSWYAILETLIYLGIALAQIYYFTNLLDGNGRDNKRGKTWA